MTDILESKSSIISLITNGRFTHILTPWKIIVDLNELTITIKKRNWFLIGFDTNTYAFKYVRNILIDSHLFGADIKVRVIGGNAEALSIPKKIALKIKDLLIQYNNQKNKKHVVFH